MARPRQDGTPSRQASKRKLTDAFLTSLKPDDSRRVVVWDTLQRGLAVAVQPKPSGRKAWKAVYYAPGGRPRWYHIGDADAVGLADARKIAAKVMLQAAEGKDPMAERRAERSKDTFEELATQYLEEYAKRRNKSWKQADALVQRHLIPKWGKLQAANIFRTDVKAMMASIKAPIVANQTLAAASAIFAWGIKEEIVKVNPCTRVDRNETKERERVLSDSEVPKFWAAFDSAGLAQSVALKVILLTGQRPGEVTHMRREHVVDGWWEMPGKPVPKLDWPGTKNGESHKVWLSPEVQALLAEMPETGRVFSVAKLDAAMRAICGTLGVDSKVTPHDLRRTFSSKVTGLGFGRDAMNRVTNHRDGGIASVYDRHEYADENKSIMETVAARIMMLVEGKKDDNVVPIRKGRKSKI